MASVKQAAIVLTSASDMNGKETGYWLEECAAPYYVFDGANYEVDIVSVLGGKPPLDKGSTADDFMTEDATRFMRDTAAQKKLSHSVSVPQVIEEQKKYDIVFAAGGHGTTMDFSSNASLRELLEKTYREGGVVAAVCHGPTALISMSHDDNTPLVKGMTVTAFTNEEEEAVQLKDKVPFLLEDKLKELGANFVAKDPWSSHVEVDGRLVTGQNPQSSKECAQKALEAVSSK
mmetsp:Transcript_10819/g.33172  ORF Transcript_10819/g.33172 Transcript_10819/m.33172 type:complete len:232 (-) Transcript_10819:1332-2027(-)